MRRWQRWNDDNMCIQFSGCSRARAYVSKRPADTKLMRQALEKQANVKKSSTAEINEQTENDFKNWPTAERMEWMWVGV